MTDYPTIPLAGYREYPVDEMRERVNTLYTELSRRRTVREFSDRPVPIDIIKTAIKKCRHGTERRQSTTLAFRRRQWREDQKEDPRGGRG